MVVLTTSLAEQSFYFISRSNTIDGMFLTDEQTNITTEVTINTLTIGDYTNIITAEFALTENHFYMMELRDGANVVFKDKVFCTDQQLVTFSVNNGQYIVNSSSNDFIIYE